MTRTESTSADASVVPHPRPNKYIGMFEVILRILMLILLVTALALVAASEQSKTFPVVIPGSSVPILVSAKAKFQYLEPVVYFVVAISVGIFYSIITTLVSLYNFIKFKSTFTSKLAIYIVILDVLFLGLTASAGGAAAGVSYIGFKGNKHVGWQKVCHIYSKFCWKAGSGVVISLLCAIVQVQLITLYVVAQYKRIPNKVHYQQNGL